MPTEEVSTETIITKAIQGRPHGLRDLIARLRQRESELEELRNPPQPEAEFAWSTLGPVSATFEGEMTPEGHDFIKRVAGEVFFRRLDDTPGAPPKPPLMWGEETVDTVATLWSALFGREVTPIQVEAARACVIAVALVQGTDR